MRTRMQWWPPNRLCAYTPHTLVGRGVCAYTRFASVSASLPRSSPLPRLFVPSRSHCTSLCTPPLSLHFCCFVFGSLGLWVFVSFSFSIPLSTPSSHPHTPHLCVCFACLPFHSHHSPRFFLVLFLLLPGRANPPLLCLVPPVPLFFGPGTRRGNHHGRVGGLPHRLGQFCESGNGSSRLSQPPHPHFHTQRKRYGVHVALVLRLEHVMVCGLDCGRWTVGVGRRRCAHPDTIDTTDTSATAICSCSCCCYRHAPTFPLPRASHRAGCRPVHGDQTAFSTDANWADHILFYEYFHGMRTTHRRLHTWRFATFAPCTLHTAACTLHIVHLPVACTSPWEWT